MPRRTLHFPGLALVAASFVCAAACDKGMDRTEAKAIGTVPPNTTLSGSVTIDGSSTVLPVSTCMAEAFRQEHSAVQTTIHGSGTGAGFKKFCAGQLDLADASRPINRAESEECAANKVEFVELPFAFDAVSVVASRQNGFLECLTVPELRRIWEPAAEKQLTRWSQVRNGFPDRPIKLFGPGGESGTFDYFTLAIVGKESISRSDYVKSEDDEVLAKGIAADHDALGYFGLSYYAEHRDTLKLIAVNSGSGCVAPSVQAIAEGTYQPLTRPMFIYANKTALQRPEVAQLAHYFVAPESARFSLELGYMPLPTVTLLSVAKRLDQGVTGSVFGNRGSVLGVTVDTFADEDKVKSALVR
jgi:phosphate transport system substrate-binding protein